MKLLDPARPIMSSGEPSLVRPDGTSLSCISSLYASPRAEGWRVQLYLTKAFNRASVVHKTFGSTQELMEFYEEYRDDPEACLTKNFAWEPEEPEVQKAFSPTKTSPLTMLSLEDLGL